MSNYFLFTAISFLHRSLDFKNSICNKAIITVHKHMPSYTCLSKECICIFTLALTLISPQTLLAQEITCIEHIENFQESGPTCISLPIIKKSQRLRSNAALSFQLEPEENVPDSVIKCMEVASDIWRSCLKMNSEYQIRLALKWEELEDGQDIKVQVYYYPGSDGNNYPISLYYSLHPDALQTTSADAIITINKNIRWDCGYSTENNQNIRNLNYAMLRSIAVALGFGSSISKTKLFNGDTIIKFPFTQGHSLFDNLLISDNGMRLNELQNTGRKQNENIIKYCTGQFGKVYIEGLANSVENDSTYNMYTPPTYEENRSLIYLNNPASIMYHSLAKANKILQIDPATINILNKMGWNIESSNTQFKIVGEDIPESGITSAYSPHSFSIVGEGLGNIQNPKWQFVLPAVNGADVITAASEGELIFSINAIGNPNDYLINVNGDIYGKIIFTGSINGSEIKLIFNITLELKPSISKVDFIQQNNSGYDTYNVVCKVDYKGADYLFVSLEEEFGATLRSQFVREPYLAHFVCKDITSPYYAWIDITVENDYGSETYTIELPPYDNTSNFTKSTDNTRHRIDDNEISEIKVFNINGQYIKSINSLSETKSLISGAYVLEYYQKNKKIKNSKLLK